MVLPALTSVRYKPMLWSVVCLQKNPSLCHAVTCLCLHHNYQYKWGIQASCMLRNRKVTFTGEDGAVVYPLGVGRDVADLRGRFPLPHVQGPLCAASHQILSLWSPTPHSYYMSLVKHTTYEWCLTGILRYDLWDGDIGKISFFRFMVTFLNVIYNINIDILHKIIKWSYFIEQHN